MNRWGGRILRLFSTICSDSCWQEDQLKAEVEIKVVKPKEAPPDLRVALLYLAVGLAFDVLIFLALMVVRHRQRKAVRMKGYKELYDDTPMEKNKTVK